MAQIMFGAPFLIIASRATIVLCLASGCWTLGCVKNKGPLTFVRGLMAWLGFDSGSAANWWRVVLSAIFFYRAPEYASAVVDPYITILWR